MEHKCMQNSLTQPLTTLSCCCTIVAMHVLAAITLRACGYNFIIWQMKHCLAYKGQKNKYYTHVSTVAARQPHWSCISILYTCSCYITNILSQTLMTWPSSQIISSPLPATGKRLVYSWGCCQGNWITLQPHPCLFQVAPLLSFKRYCPSG